MSRYVDADAFVERVRVAVGFAEEELTADFKDGVHMTLELLETQPLADVVEVVRCKDCKYGERKDYMPAKYCSLRYCKNSSNYHGKDFYCAMGEKRDE